MARKENEADCAPLQYGALFNTPLKSARETRWQDKTEELNGKTTA